MLNVSNHITVRYSFTSCNEQVVSSLTLYFCR